MNRAAPLLLACLLPACASYRFLPLPAGAPHTLDYRSTRAFFFHDDGSDAAIERVFQDPRPGGATLLTVLSPVPGVVSSHDGGANWNFFKLAQDENRSPHLFRQVLFDPTDTRRIYAQAANGILLSRDGGESFQPLQINEYKNHPVDALALGPDGALYTAINETLYVSLDQGQSFITLPFELATSGLKTGPGITDDARPARVRIRSILPDPTHTSTIYLSVEAEPPATNFQRRLLGLLEGNSDEAAQAHALFALQSEHPIDHTAFGDPRAGIYVSRDGGRGWQKTSLGIDCWLVERDGAVAAVAAEPILMAYTLAQRSPALAAMISAQLHESHAAADTLRPSLEFPGRENLLGQLPSSLFFITTDQAATWTHLINPELPLTIAMRLAIEQQRAAKYPWPPRPPVQKPADTNGAQQSGPSSGRGRGGRGGRGGGGRRNSNPSPENLAPPPDLTEPLLTLLDPTLLLAHLGSGLPLTGVSNLTTSNNILWAYAPTAAYWATLAGALIHSTHDEGELTLGGASAPAPDGNAFQLLRSEDGGKSWNPLAPGAAAGNEGLHGYPGLVVGNSEQALFLFVDHSGLGPPAYTLLHRSK